MSETNASTTDRLYTRQFFRVAAAVMLFMTGVALQFHFGQYIAYLGHGVDILGRLLGISMVGTLLIRLQLGHWIDRFGCRPTWLVGCLTMALAVGAIQFTESLWSITVLRALSAMATAAVMTTVAVFAAQIAPPHRRAESIGTMGLFGFMGMMTGPTLGDWVFSGGTESIMPYRVFFSTSAACAILAGLIITALPLAPRPSPTQNRDRNASLPSPTRPSIPRVIIQHWPGMILLIGLLFSMIFCLQFTFLERLAEARGFMNIKVFFLVYAPTAIVLRIVFRRVPQQLGRTRVVVGGLTLQAVGVFFLVGIQTQGELVLPALLIGAGHCFVFPSMVDLAAERLPPDHRGTGTALILGAGDIGILTGFLVIGELIDRFGFDLALIALATTVLLGTALFAYTRRKFVLGRRGPT